MVNIFLASYVIFIGEFLYRELFLRKGGISKKITNTKYDKGTTLFAGAFIVIGFWIPIILKIFPIGYPIQNFSIPFIGVVLMILGTMLQAIAVKTLGRFYARTLLIQEQHTIIKNGIYKFIRHPGYIGGILVWEGFGLGTGDWLGVFIISLLTFSFYFYRMVMEEKMLIDTFGNKYTEYMKGTKRFIPYIY